MTANKKTQLFEPRHLSKTTFPLQTSYGNPLSFRVYRTSPLRPYLSVDTNATQYPKTKKIERGAGGSTVPLSYLMWASLAPLCSLRACNLSDEKHGINTVVLWNPTVECRFRRTSIHFSVTHFNNIQMLCGRRMHKEFQI